MPALGKCSRTLLLAAGLVAIAPAHAEDFNIQLQLSHDVSSFDTSGVPDVDATSFNATYYFDPVVTDGMPVPEAAFVTRKSYFNAAMSHAEFGDGDGDVLIANAGFHVPHSMLFGRIGLVRDDGPVGGSDTSLNGTIGIVPMSGSFFGTDFHEDGYDPNITARYAGKLGNGRWFSASVNAADPDAGDTVLGFQADYYLDGIAFGGGFSTGSDRWNVRIDKGLPHGFGLLVRYHGEDGGRGIGAMLTWRDLGSR